MKQVLIDTNIYSEFKRGNPRVLKVLRHVDFIGINTTVIGELLSGFRIGNKYEINNDEFISFLDTPRVNVLGLSYKTAEFYSLIFSQLKKAGTPIPTNDMWIAASAMEHGLELITLDRHFDEIQGLLKINMGV